eukprot:CAMPEP_0172183390 /NCGR_PEP_ID=MMETSP1050-20130122/18963_1 /TAXON_ID=233186 /ORGANISM="Cryptomonas curvata, Strain CCAP979/52" /LENGTH=50 /DNA_ID=CAMNT_0012857011 /DNA_START=116 /DNA_END=265 /DNA_ORIENTATION=+
MAEINRAHSGVLKQGQGWSVRFRMRHKDGRMLWVNTCARLTAKGLASVWR